MHASDTTRSKLHSRQAVLFVAAVPLLFASTAWSQLPTPPPRLPATGTQTNGSLPPAQPTQSQPTPAPQPASAPAPHVYRARVEFANNQLTIAAENSSLNEILSEIARLTGMKITGGVNDERVYGSYGPDTAQNVLNELLDGTGTNVLFLSTSHNTLAELVLTPRNGGPTPPSPNAAREENRTEENFPPGLAGRRRDFPPGGRHGRIDEIPGQEVRQTDPSQSGQQPPFGQQPPAPPSGSDSNGAQPDASQQSPNGVKTPQQIYDDLVKQQAQQQQQAPTNPPQ